MFIRFSWYISVAVCWLLASMMWTPRETNFCEANDTSNSVKERDSVWIFSYFNNNGEDGLHLAVSLDGKKWKALNNDKSILKPEVGKDKLMRDPCIIHGPDGRFHMVWTSGWNDNGIGYASSADLVHWSEQNYIPVMAHEPKVENCWAPELIYDQQKKQYMIFWASTIPGKFSETAGNGDHNHRIYFTTTKDFKIFSMAAILYNQGFNVIDATIIPIGKGYAMFLKDETLKPAPEKNIRIAYSNKADGDFGKPGKPITGKYWAEGPTVLKADDKYIVYFDRYMDHKFGALESADLVNWLDISNEISVPKGIRHGSITRISATKFGMLESALK